MDADEARDFLRKMTDDRVGQVGEVPEGQRHEAAVQAVAQVQGAGLALMAAAGLPVEDVREAKLAMVEALADLGHLDRTWANWAGARTGPRQAVLPEHDQRPEQQAAPVTGVRLVRVVPWGMEVGPDQAGAMLVLASLEVYEDRLIARLTRLGGDPAQDDPARRGLMSWPVSDDTGRQLKVAGVTAIGPLPFQPVTLVLTPAAAEEATSLFLTVQTATGPEPVTLPLHA